MMTDMENFIQLKKSSVLRLGIKDDKGNPTGEFLEFDLEDIELPLIYQEMVEENKKNHEWLKDRITIIDKRQDHKGKKLMSYNQEEKIKAINEFYKKEVEILDKFLGKDGVKKLLNGRKIGWTTLDEIDELIEKQIAPHLDLSMDNLKDKIKNKYSKLKDKNKEVLE